MLFVDVLWVVGATPHESPPGTMVWLALAYAGIGTITRYRGIPPYAETIAYVAKVQALHARYRTAMKLPPLDHPLRAAQ